jgi:hypothetical protein
MIHLLGVLEVVALVVAAAVLVALLFKLCLVLGLFLGLCHIVHSKVAWVELVVLVGCLSASLPITVLLITTGRMLFQINYLEVFLPIQ